MNTLFKFLDIDIALVSIFLVITLVVGIYYGRQVKDLKDYALGGKNFSTSTLVATIVATVASGSSLFIIIEKTYSQGLYYMLARLGLPLSVWLYGHLAVRMGEFMHNLSVAEAMGNLYGKGIRVFTAICSIIVAMGYVAIQFQVMGTLLSSLINLDPRVITAIAASIVLVYTTFGGVRSVTFTDVLQFFTFGLLIPILTLAIWNRMQSPAQQATATLATHPLFDFKTVVSWTPEFMTTIGLFLYWAIPGYNPQAFQRIVMARDPQQAKRAFTYSAGIFLVLFILQAWMGILLLVDNPGIIPGKAVTYLIQHHVHTGLRGLLGVGIVALAMSTADSVLNASSVLFANDVVKPLADKDKGTVITARVFSWFMGLAALVLALRSKDILNLILACNSFYMPIVTVPMLMAVLGFRSTTRAVLIGMAAGGITVILWSIMGRNTASIVPGMLANLVGLVGSHYLLMEPGGWMPLEPTSPLALARAARQHAWEQRLRSILKFNLYAYFRHNLPQQESSYVFFSFYIIAANYMAFYTIHPSTIPAYRDIYHGLSYIVLVTAIGFFTFPIWSLKFKKYRFLTFFWPLGIATILFVVGPMLVLLSNFNPAQMMVMMLNFLIAVLLLQWSLAIILALGGISLTVFFFQKYTGEVLLWSNVSSLPFPYGPLLFASFMIVLYRGRKAYTKLDREKKILTRLDQEHQEELLAAVAKNRQTVQAFKNTQGERLLVLAKELTGADAAHLQDIQAQLIPLAFQLQGLATKAQDYLRLHIVKFPIKQWMQRVQNKLHAKGLANSLYSQIDTQCKELEGDAECMTQLLVKSVAALRASNKAQQEEEQPAILIGLEDTLLTYPLPDVEPGYVKQVPALRVVVTIAGKLPPLARSYAADFSASQATAPRTTQALDQLTNEQIIKAHYGYAAVSPSTLCYVFPVNVKEVRPRDLDKPYMELGAKAVRANDHFKNDQIDAQAQEQEFLAAVAQRSKADIDLVKVALELIKWYHGPVSRNSGEPFYLHPLSVAQIVLDYNTDEATILGALLHDTVEDTAMLLNHIETVFGQDTAEVVNVVTHLQSIPGSLYKVKLSAEENIRMLERTGNERALYVKLADRMHNIRTIAGHAALAKRQQKAEETLRFFVPLAERLGLEQAKEELQARCLKVL